jgi:hypothetical protein
MIQNIMARANAIVPEINVTTVQIVRMMFSWIRMKLPNLFVDNIAGAAPYPPRITPPYIVGTMKAEITNKEAQKLKVMVFIYFQFDCLIHYNCSFLIPHDIKRTEAVVNINFQRTLLT